jgi:hypothetical protein
MNQVDAGHAAQCLLQELSSSAGELAAQPKQLQQLITFFRLTSELPSLRAAGKNTRRHQPERPLREKETNPVASETIPVGAASQDDLLALLMRFALGAAFIHTLSECGAGHAVT